MRLARCSASQGSLVEGACRRHTRRAHWTPHARYSALPPFRRRRACKHPAGGLGSRPFACQHISHLTTPTQGDVWILKMSFGPCSKNLAENRFWSLSAWGAGRPPSPPVALGTGPRNQPQADVIWSPREGWAAPARFRRIQADRKDLPLARCPTLAVI